ncbi:Acyl carrier protein chloroplastic [Euphorbia peplus]|nr:Acyl carrier protein chloroplastic [Euphorbia peplus]
MASFLASPSVSITAFSTSSTAHQRNLSANGTSLYLGLKRIPAMKFSKAANMSATRPKCFNTTISCSAQVETLEIVQSTIAKQLSIEASTVAPETKFADLGADSLDTVEIMMALEEQFGVSIGEGGAENIATVQDAADLIEKVKNASA